jgi:tetratricopeptide (TPR) repeat protein
MSRGQHSSKPKPGPRSSDSQMMLIAVILTLGVVVLGGIVLFLKLKPAGPSNTLAGQFLASAKNAVAEAPNNSWSHVGLGVALLQSGDVAGAKAEFEKALSLDKNNWQANLNLAELIGDDDPERALQLLDIAAKNTSSAEIPYLDIGNIQYKLGNYADAKAAYLRSVAIVSTLYDSRVGLARAYEALGEKKLALQQYAQALRLSPGDPEARAALARLRGFTPSSPIASPTT